MISNHTKLEVYTINLEKVNEIKAHDNFIVGIKHLNEILVNDDNNLIVSLGFESVAKISNLTIKKEKQQPSVKLDPKIKKFYYLNNYENKNEILFLGEKKNYIWKYEQNDQSTSLTELKIQNVEFSDIHSIIHFYNYFRKIEKK